MITKNIVSVIAALGIMLSAAPITSAYAAETATVSVTSEASDGNVSIEQLVGQWKYQVSDTNYDVDISSKDNGTVVISKDGTYTYTDVNGKTSTGTVKLGFETIGSTTLQTVDFYEGSEHKFGGYYRQNDPDALYMGNNRISRLVRKGSAEVNLNDFLGKWKYQESNGGYPVDISAREIGTFEISADGTYKYTDIDGNTSKGEVKVGDETIGSKMFAVLRFIEGSEIKYTATCLNARPDELYLGNSGRIRLVREADKKSLNTHAIEKMEAYSFFDSLFASGIAHSDEEAFKKDDISYYRVTDFSLFKSIEELKDIIGKKFTGEVKDYFMKECDARFAEKDNILYESDGRRGSLLFDTSEGVMVSDVTADKFTATTVLSNQIQGKCKAVFVLENGSWKMSSFTTGDFKTESAPVVNPVASVIGDANCDGQVDMSDAVLVMQALANPNKYGENGTATIHLSAQGRANADSDGNGLTVGDAHTIQEKLLDL